MKLKNNTKTHSKNFLKILALTALSATLMGNQSCNEPPATAQDRLIRRKVQLGKILAPEITISGGLSNVTKFNFAEVANYQMYDVLNKTNAFTTANVEDSNYDPSSLDRISQQEFNSCENDEQVFNSFSQKTGAPVYSTLSKSTLSSYGGCLIDMPQGIVSGNIFDFYLYSATDVGLTVPFSLSGVGGSVGGSFDFKKYALDLQLKVKNPLEVSSTKYVVTTTRKAYQKVRDTSLNVNFIIGFNFSNYFNSGLSTVVYDGLTDGINDLSSQWSAVEEPYAMILKGCDKFIYINGGGAYDFNFKVGDIVRVQNVTYRWSGDVCQSNVTGELAQTPIAYAKITSVGRNLSAAVIIEQDPKYPRVSATIYPGSRVYIEKTIETQNAEAAAAAAAEKAKKSSSNNNSNSQANNSY